MLHKEGGGEQRRQIEEGVNIESTNRSIRAQKSLSLCEMLAKSSELCRQLIVLCRQVEVVAEGQGARGRGRQKDSWQTSLQRGEGGGGPSVVWISLYNYLVTRNNGVGPGNMPKTFNEPDERPVAATVWHVGVSWLHTHTHTPTCV